jgi:hypothetical protein
MKRPCLSGTKSRRNSHAKEGAEHQGGFRPFFSHVIRPFPDFNELFFIEREKLHQFFTGQGILAFAIPLERFKLRDYLKDTRPPGFPHNQLEGVEDGIPAGVGNPLFQKKIFNRRRGNFGKLEFSKPGEDIAGQVAAVLGYGLGFQDISLFCPSLNMGRAVGKHILGKIAYGYVLSHGTPGASLTLLLFKVGDQGHGAGFRSGLGSGIPVLGQGIRQILEASAPPFGAYALGQPGCVVKGDLEGF